MSCDLPAGEIDPEEAAPHRGHETPSFSKGEGAHGMRHDADRIGAGRGIETMDFARQDVDPIECLFPWMPQGSFAQLGAASNHTCDLDHFDRPPSVNFMRRDELI